MYESFSSIGPRIIRHKSGKTAREHGIPDVPSFLPAKPKNLHETRWAPDKVDEYTLKRLSFRTLSQLGDNLCPL